ncbi:hypothetical protein [Amycolatopsis sacchari]|uniref:hypothetical protein n=1 Tax=Amycolatopsis sacchari TaxID=115433 RepID=UPI003D715705
MLKARATLVVACHRSRRGFSIMEDHGGRSATRAVRTGPLSNVSCVTDFERISPITAEVAQTLVDLRKHSFRHQSQLFPLVTNVAIATPGERIAGTPSVQVRGRAVDIGRADNRL